MRTCEDVNEVFTVTKGKQEPRDPGPVPTDYDEFYRLYFYGKTSIAWKVCRHFMFRVDDSIVEDAVHNAFIRVMSAKFLERYRSGNWQSQTKTNNRLPRLLKDRKMFTVAQYVFRACWSSCAKMAEVPGYKDLPLEVQVEGKDGEYVYTREPSIPNPEEAYIASERVAELKHRLDVKRRAFEIGERMSGAKGSRVHGLKRPYYLAPMVDLLMAGYGIGEIADIFQITPNAVQLWVNSLEEEILCVGGV